MTGILWIWIHKTPTKLGWFFHPLLYTPEKSTTWNLKFTYTWTGKFIWTIHPIRVLGPQPFKENPFDVYINPPTKKLTSFFHPESGFPPTMRDISSAPLRRYRQWIRPGSHLRRTPRCNDHTHYPWWPPIRWKVKRTHPNIHTETEPEPLAKGVWVVVVVGGFGVGKNMVVPNFFGGGPMVPW